MTDLDRLLEWMREIGFESENEKEIPDFISLKAKIEGKIEDGVKWNKLRGHGLRATEFADKLWE
jgi:hypothetical protein